MSLSDLSKLIKERNKVERQIAKLIGRPGNIGPIGEFIASEIFDIALMESANTKGIDGYFNSQLKNKSVNIKWYTKDQRMLDINPNGIPDYYLVLAGVYDNVLGSTRGKNLPWVIHKVYLFNSKKLMEYLSTRKVKIGIATSITKEFWHQGEIYPTSVNKELVITDQQFKFLQLFKEAENMV